ncbi:MAG TPA: DUF2339 domain-containing protein [Nitrolancea sp.]|nr:DUF2339 domain-containing protein [Nitrolancea sp.]
MDTQQERQATRFDEAVRIEHQIEEIDRRVQALERWAATMYWNPLLPATPRRQPVQSTPPQAPAGSPDVVLTTAAVAPAAPAPRSTPPAGPAPAPPPPTRTLPPVARPPTLAPRWTLGDLDQLLSGRGLAWLGGLAILLGALFFLGLAFTRGWIGPEARVGIGLVAGIGLVTGGAWRFTKHEVLFGHVLVATGLGVLSLAFVAATRLYDLVPVEAGLAGALLVAIAAALIAIRADSQLVAGYGLVTALAAPPLLGAAPTFATIAFLATALIGTTAIALYRTWAWLPPVAFVLAAPQLAEWIFGGLPASFAPALAALAGFWLLNSLAAGGEEFRVRHNRLRPTSATLLLANAAFLVWAGFGHLARHDAEGARGLLLLIVAVAHGLLGGYFLYEDGERHPFGLLACGTGLATFTIAIPVQLGGPVVPIAWAAEAAALAWVYAWRRHGYSGAAALVLGGLAVAHLASIEYPFWQIASEQQNTAPFFNAQGGTLGFILLALAVAGFFVRSWPVRAGLTSAGAILVLYALPFELSGLALLACFAAALAIEVALNRAFLLLRARRVSGAAPVMFRVALYLPSALAAVLTAGHALLFELPPRLLGVLPATPFSDNATLAAGMLVAASLIAGELAGQPATRRAGRLAAIAVFAYLLPFELHSAAVVAGWAALTLALGGLAAWDHQGERYYLGAAAMLVALGFVVGLTLVAPPERLVVDGRTTLRHPPLWCGATAAFGALAAILALGAWRYQKRRWARSLAILAGGALIYLLSVGVVDEFQGRVGGAVAFASLRKGGQVALSILWAALGGAAFVGGVIRRITSLRLAGLALLALATGKVVLVDLASLDATYRVPSFIALGLFLLASSYVYQRLRPQPPRQEAH